MQFSRPNEPSRRLVLGALAALPTFSVPLVASAQTQTTTAQASLSAAAGFSFVAVGDTRPMMYLPLKEGQPDLSKFFVEMFGLVMPEKVAEAVVAKDVKMIFDPVTKDLIKVVMPFASTPCGSGMARRTPDADEWLDTNSENQPDGQITWPAGRNSD